MLHKIRAQVSFKRVGVGVMTTAMFAFVGFTAGFIFTASVGCWFLWNKLQASYAQIQTLENNLKNLEKVQEQLEALEHGLGQLAQNTEVLAATLPLVPADIGLDVQRMAKGSYFLA